VGATRDVADPDTPRAGSVDVDGEGGGPRATGREARRPSGARPRSFSGTGWGSAAAATDTAAGLILGVWLWLWVGLPLVQGGPTAVRNVWRAKLFNKDKDGKWLP